MSSKPRTHVSIAIAIAVTGIAVPRSARAQVPPGYEIIRITKNDVRDTQPDINACGQVVWSRYIAPARDSAEIFLYDDATGRTTRVTDDGVQDFAPSINDHGTLAWTRRSGSGETLEIAKFEENRMVLITSNDYDDLGPDINNLGHIAWRGNAGTGCSDRDIFFFDGEGTQRITRGNGFSNLVVRINDRDELVWTGYDFCQNPWVGHILMYSNGQTVQLNEGTGEDQTVDINNEGLVVWGRGEGGLMMWQDGERWEFTDEGRFGFLNDSGDIAITIWNVEQGSWDQWLYLNEAFFVLTDEPEKNSNGNINRHGEVAWRRGSGAEEEVLVLRRRFGHGNSDGTVDQIDFELLADCFSGPGSPYPDCACRFFDSDRDLDVDLVDFAEFQTVFSRAP